MVRGLILQLISMGWIPDEKFIQFDCTINRCSRVTNVFLQCLVVSSCGVLWYGFLCSLAPDMGWMLFLRFMVGGTGEGTDMA